MNLHDLLIHFHDLVFKEAQITHQQTQRGTTELFFDTDANQKAFFAATQRSDMKPDGKSFAGIVPQTLWKYLQTSGAKEVSYRLEAIANPGKGARWLLTATPEGIKPLLAQALNVEYAAIMKSKMAERANQADKAAKAGNAGSGTILVASGEMSA